MTATGLPERPKAYSYVRFSTPEQAHGDSLRRQMEAARGYAERHGLELDETLTFQDLGTSAFRGLNVGAGKLGAFLDAVSSGDVAPGAYLLVESLDRISRENIRRAVATMELIVSSGITLVDLSDGEKLYNSETLDGDSGFSFIMMALRFMRAHEESAMKSRRVLAAYDNKRAKAKAQVPEPFTRMLPAWLRWDDATKRHVAIPDRSEVLLSIFTKADEGWGQHRIAGWLNEQKVPTWGGHGNQRKAKFWHRSYVKKLLGNPAVVGTFTPQQKREDANGTIRREQLDPIENYFPAVVDSEVFERVRARSVSVAPKGRNASRQPASIFAGVIRCAHCGGLVTRVSKGEYVYLVCSRAHRNGANACIYQTVRYTDVEDAFRANAKAIVKEAPRGLDSAELQDEIEAQNIIVDELSDEARYLADELIAEKSPVLRKRLREKEAELNAAQESLRELLARRDALAKPYVQRRLVALQEALLREPFDVADANKALREVVSKIVMNPEAGSLSIHWHHSPQTTNDISFHSRHCHLFDDERGTQ